LRSRAQEPPFRRFEVAFGFRFRRFDHLGDQLLLAQLSGTLCQFGAHRQHLALSLGFGQGAGLGGLGLGLIDLGLVLSLDDGGLTREFGLFTL
jgi:hypothetical protein